MVQAEDHSDLAGGLRSENQAHKRRIQELIHTATECRERIDRLLGMKSKKMSFGDDEYFRDSLRRRSSGNIIDSNRRGSRSRRFRSDRDTGSFTEEPGDDSAKREKTEHIIEHTGTSNVDAGGIILVSTTPMASDQPPKEPVESTIQMTPSNEKKKFKFGTINLQVKL